MVHEETKSLISGSNANNTELATHIIGRLNVRLIRTIFIAVIVMAAALIALEAVRNEEPPIVFRNSSIPVANSTIHASYLEPLVESHDDNIGHNIDTYNDTNSDTFDDTNYEGNNDTSNDTNTNSSNTTRQPTNWTAIHLAEAEKTKQDLQVLKDKMQSRFITLDPSEEILNYRQLEEQFRPLLQARGILFMGDSTTRLLFGNLWCLMEGAYRSEAEFVENVCQERLDEMKGKCQFAGTPCRILANFTNGTTPIHLEFEVQWFVGEMEGHVVDVIRRNRNRFIFYLMPCIHQLWLPGSMEKYVDKLYPTCYPFFPDLYTSIEKANPAHTFFFGTTTAICDSKLWAKKMVDMYLEEKEFVDGTPRPLATMYRNKHTAPLAANYRAHSCPYTIAKRPPVRQLSL
ncbi:hypothetical protein MHU86_12558 [Fragilaria crotonensis]|nr:hypothetical protein MHU86_12558 [Fragilaria crotonensis]